MARSTIPLDELPQPLLHNIPEARCAIIAGVAIQVKLLFTDVPTLRQTIVKEAVGILDLISLGYLSHFEFQEGCVDLPHKKMSPMTSREQHRPPKRLQGLNTVSTSAMPPLSDLAFHLTKAQMHSGLVDGDVLLMSDREGEVIRYGLGDWRVRWAGRLALGPSSR